MGLTKRIVCLANSRKLEGRCIAGRELHDGVAGQWIRPVSSRPHEEMSEYERQFSNGSEPSVLDIMDVRLVEPRPHEYQQENWLVDSNFIWARRGRAHWDDLAPLAERNGALWINGHHTTNGYNDMIPLTLACNLRSSLALIHVDKLDVSVVSDVWHGQHRHRVQAHFVWQGEHYRLWVTDTVMESQYLPMPEAIYRLGECYLTISLGEPFRSACFKLIAAVIQRNPGSTP